MSSLLRAFEEADQLFRPARNRHALALKDVGLAYVRVPKAANTSVKRVLHTLAWPDRPLRKVGRQVNRDDYWLARAGDQVELCTYAELKAQPRPPRLIFTVVRNPFGRLVSCYLDKIVRRRELLASFRNMGFRKDVSFEEFAFHALSIGDLWADNHYRSQWDMLSYEGHLVPHQVCRLETLPRDWRRLQRRVERRCGVRLPALPRSNQKPGGSDASWTPFADRALVRAIRRRYARDFELFYPDLDDPTPQGQVAVE